MNKKSFLILTLSLLLAGIFSPSPAFAQTPDAGSLILVTSPLPINLVTQPGATITTDLRVKNGGTKTETLTVGLMKFGAYGDEGKPKLVDRESGDEFFDWITFSESSFDAAPNEWKTITATIKVPESAAFGYYYAVTFSRAQGEAPSGPRQTAIVGATATLVLLEVRVPNAKREIEVVEFSADRAFYEFLPAAFTIKLKNKGNVHVAPRGNIFINQGKKKDIAIVEVNPDKGNLLPDSNRIFTSEWKDGFPVYTPKMENNAEVHDAKGKLVKQLKWDFSRAHTLRWGKYTANMLLVYDDGTRDQAIEGTVSFWVIPWRMVGGASLVVLLMFFGLWSMIKNFFVRSGRS
ncbi:hypothetical protein HY949_04830 [Candidatus Gottesmanbacteria bacterium]|nr:hypothetical protein [Candidatus Gottesmanbacteria bacterium]